MRTFRGFLYFLPCIFLFISFFSGCGGGGTKEGTSLPVGQACLSLSCHGGKNLTMDIVTADGTTETIPLYVDIAAYSVTKHGKVECLECHVDMNPTPPHNAPRTYGSWGFFSAIADNVKETRNYYGVPAIACLKCHSEANYIAFNMSDHATDKDRRFNFDNTPRVEIEVRGNDGVLYPVNEPYTPEGECGSCHINRNCGTCHWKSKIVQQLPGSATSLWTQYDSDSSDAKTAMTEKWMDWTVNVASHDFNGRKELTASNEVCSACHSGFYDEVGSGDFPPLGIEGRVIEGHPQVEEMILSVTRGVHTTKQFCTDCHSDTHTSSVAQTASNGWFGGKIQCINCHFEEVITGAHADITCIGCHDAELTVMRDKTTNMVVPKTVDVNLEKSWPSHNIIKGKDIQCKKCHVEGNTIGAPVKVNYGLIHK